MPSTPQPSTPTGMQAANEAARLWAQPSPGVQERFVQKPQEKQPKATSSSGLVQQQQELPVKKVTNEPKSKRSKRSEIEAKVKIMEERLLIATKNCKDAIAKREALSRSTTLDESAILYQPLRGQDVEISEAQRVLNQLNADITLNATREIELPTIAPPRAVPTSKSPDNEDYSKSRVRKYSEPMDKTWNRVSKKSWNIEPGGTTKPPRLEG